MPISPKAKTIGIRSVLKKLVIDQESNKAIMVKNNKENNNPNKYKKIKKRKNKFVLLNH